MFHQTDLIVVVSPGIFVLETNNSIKAREVELDAFWQAVLLALQVLPGKQNC